MENRRNNNKRKWKSLETHRDAKDDNDDDENSETKNKGRRRKNDLRRLGNVNDKREGGRRNDNLGDFSRRRHHHHYHPLPHLQRRYPKNQWPSNPEPSKKRHLLMSSLMEEKKEKIKAERGKNTATAVAATNAAALNNVGTQSGCAPSTAGSVTTPSGPKESGRGIRRPNSKSRKRRSSTRRKTLDESQASTPDHVPGRSSPIGCSVTYNAPPTEKDPALLSPNCTDPDPRHRWKTRRRKSSWRPRGRRSSGVSDQDFHLRLEPLKVQPRRQSQQQQQHNQLQHPTGRRRSRSSSSRRRSRSKSHSESESRAEPQNSRQRRDGRRGTPGASASDTATPSNSPSTSRPASRQESSLELPGFYFDETKRRYFKILPKSFQAPDVVTSDVVRFKERQKCDRRKGGGSVDRRGPAKDAVQVNDTLCSVGLEQLSLAAEGRDDSPTPKAPRNVGRSLLHALSLRGNGDSFPVTRRRSTSAFLRSLEPWKRCRIFERPRNTYEHLDGAMFVDKDVYDQSLLCMWNVKDTMCQRIQLLDLNLPDLDEERDENRTEGAPEIQGDIVIPHSSPMLQSLNKVTDLSWAPEQGAPGSDHWIIYTTTSLMCGSVPSFALLRNLDAPDDPEVGANYSLGSAKVTWSCAWSSWSRKFCIGCEKGATMIDARSRRSWDVNTGNQDALCLTFAESDPNLLFTGLRDGAVLAHDVRSTAGRAQFRLSRRQRGVDRACAVVTSLRCPRGPRIDGNYIFSGTNGGEIFLWDLRNRKPVVVLSTGVSASTSTGVSKNPVCIDDDVDVAYQGADDHVVRFWSLDPWGSPPSLPLAQFPAVTATPYRPGQGRSAWSVPEDATGDKDAVPRPVFSWKWQSPGQPALPLVIALVRDEVVFYRGLR